MSKWTDRIESHSIWAEMKRMSDVLRLVKKNNSENADVVVDVTRISSILDFTRSRVSAIDPNFLVPSFLDPPFNSLSSIRVELESFLTDNNPNRFNTINLRVDELLAHVRGIPVQTNKDLPGIQASVAEFKKTIEEYLVELLEKLKVIKNSNNGNKTALSNLQQSIEIEKEKISKLAIEMQSAFSSSQNKRASDFGQITNDLQNKFVSQLNENQTSFSNVQIENQKNFSEVINQFEDEFSEKSNQFSNLLTNSHNKSESNLNRLKSNYEKLAKQILDDINSHKQQVELLVGVIGNLGVTSGYLKSANHARIAAYVWQLITVSALVGLIAVAYKMAFPSSNAISFAYTNGNMKIDNSSVSNLIFYQGLSVRIFLSITFGIFAAYAARQADKFFNIEKNNRKLALELEALGPFIAPLPIEMQHKFRAEIGERSFGHKEETVSKDDSAPVSFMDLVKTKDFEEVFSRFVRIFKSSP